MYNPYTLPDPKVLGITTAATSETPKYAKPAVEFRLTKNQVKVLKEGALKGMRVDEGTMAGTIGTASLWAVPQVAGNLKLKSDVVTNTFLTKDLSLFETNPNLATETMQAAKKMQKKFARDIKRLNNAGKSSWGARKDLLTLNDKLATALESGKIDEIAKVKAEMEGANSVKNGLIKRLIRKFRGGETIMSRSTAGTEALKKAGKNIAVPPENKIFSKAGAGGAALFFAATMFSEKGKIKEAYQYDKQTGNKQLFQSTSKAAISATLFTVGESAARNLVTKYAVPKMAKFAAKKLVSAGAGKVIGGAIGSCIPVVGTIVGTIVGFAIDFAFKKWISPLIFGKDEPVAKAQAENMSDEDLLNTAIQSYSMGQQLDKNSLNEIKNYYR